MDLSIIIPTYNEKENIKKLLDKIFHEFRKNGLNGEAIVVDDGSPDNTSGIVEELKKTYHSIQIIQRKEKMGLSSAIIDGFSVAKSAILCVMDADLSHPPESIYSMYNTIKQEQADLVIGSRYIKGGKIKGWSYYRMLLSKGATLLARIFTSVKDPMTGFFMIKRECLINADLNSKGFKILLEIIIKANYKKIKEIPITFVNRTEGKSKAGAGEIIYYLQNLIGYLPYQKFIYSEFMKFAFVGSIGTVINITILYALTEHVGTHYILSAVFAFVAAVTSNFVLNKTWTFKEKIVESLLNKWTLFFLVSVTALAVNLSILYTLTEFIGMHYLFSQVVAIGIALSINFLGNKIWTFSRT